MVIYYCCGCRAQYPAQPKRCPRCKGRSFAGVNDDAPTTALLLLDDAPIVVPENLDGELAAAFAEAERFRLAALSGSPYTRPAPPVAPEPANVPPPSFDDPARHPPVFERAAVVLEGAERVEGWPGHLSDVMPAELADDAPPTPRDP
jgi:hypothetical protein